MGERLFESCWFSDHDHRTVHAEELYQAFKARLMRELYAKCPSCVSYEGEQRTEGALLREKADATAGMG